MRLSTEALKVASADPSARPGMVSESADAEILARLSVSLPRSLYRQLRLHVLEQDTTLSALLARLIRKELG
jgi:hypothetical protein